MLYAALGEAIALSSGGLVTDLAKAEFEFALLRMDTSDRELLVAPSERDVLALLK